MVIAGSFDFDMNGLHFYFPSYHLKFLFAQNKPYI